MGKNKRRGVSASRREELEHLKELPWSSSVPDDDPFSLLSGPGAALDGGFLSLEEIDEADYNLAIPDPGKQNEEGRAKVSPEAKKRKQADIGGAQDEGVEIKAEEGVGEEADVKQNKKKKKKKKAAKQGERPNTLATVAETKEKDDEELVDEDGYNAWNELRLHPLLMKAIQKLGFKEPTPIQRACIPAAAYQGKDVIGAAETGSGKTLAFGLPILQRLLDEQEKVEKLMLEDEDAVEEVAPRSLLRALIITPTRELALQVTDHLKSASKYTNFGVVPIVGGMSTEKQERLLKARPEIVVGTPGRLWELMSGGEKLLVEASLLLFLCIAENVPTGHWGISRCVHLNICNFVALHLHSLSFFVLDEADRMIENGHFRELQSIIDMLPVTNGTTIEQSQDVQSCITVSSFQRKKRQTIVFSATIALSSDFRKKLKRGTLKSKQSIVDGLSSIEALSERAGMSPDAAIVDLTNASIMASNLEESFLECREEDKDAYLYYILSVHGQGRAIVFCTSVYAVHRVSDLLRTLKVTVWTLHARMQQRARLKAIDRFRENDHGALVATDVAARGLDIPGVRTVIHYQLPHSAEVYVHRSGRTARASSDGCSVALISANDRSKFASLCKAFAKSDDLSWDLSARIQLETALLNFFRLAIHNNGVLF
ncbi:hypothetical protein Cgig2_008654 [Carnegiea gigantea]|uniref:RNA helicase n=1 Tax=Carnegiea gigantea TaxID=171969 RepID=A0A9Q1JKM6_9CARY|nr:hypothetical protein Cgig2_008654 [Carnegiea gigantea]